MAACHDHGVLVNITTVLMPNTTNSTNNTNATECHCDRYYTGATCDTLASSLHVFNTVHIVIIVCWSLVVTWAVIRMVPLMLAIWNIGGGGTTKAKTLNNDISGAATGTGTAGGPLSPTSPVATTAATATATTTFIPHTVPIGVMTRAALITQLGSCVAAFGCAIASLSVSIMIQVLSLDEFATTIQPSIGVSAITLCVSGSLAIRRIMMASARVDVASRKFLRVIDYVTVIVPSMMILFVLLSLQWTAVAIWFNIIGAIYGIVLMIGLYRAYHLMSTLLPGTRHVPSRLLLQRNLFIIKAAICEGCIILMVVALFVILGTDLLTFHTILAIEMVTEMIMCSQVGDSFCSIISSLSTYVTT